MSSSLRSLLSGIIDYAGLFPPAKLPLDQAIRNYARYRTEPENWMLGRFICPAERLAELKPFAAELFVAESPFSFSVLVRSVQEEVGFLDLLEADLHAIKVFLQHHDPRATVEVLEIKLPEYLFRADRRAVLGRWLERASTKIAALVSKQITPFYEAPLTPSWRSSWQAMISALAHVNYFQTVRLEPYCRPGGFKLRCGGLETSAFPTPEQVAFAITACRDAGVSLKFTAGLHHPLRRYDHGVKTHMHGFLNVFAAGVLAHVRRLNEEQVRQIIEDEDASHFVFTDHGLYWKEWQVSLGEITLARQQAVTSFGSCSFDEPRDDLRALGLLK